ncbi:MAG: hypothetical protein AAGH57_00625 [Pseudomonadota bacterium]
MGFELAHDESVKSMAGELSMTKQNTKPRLAPFSVRFTPEERAQVEAQAGNMPLGSYIKTVVLMNGAPRYRARRKPPVRDHALLAQVLACLGSSRLASNLNQLAKATHIGSFYFDDETKRSIMGACDDTRHPPHAYARAGSEGE